jgi:hypothetical protein
MGDKYKTCNAAFVKSHILIDIDAAGYNFLSISLSGDCVTENTVERKVCLVNTESRTRFLFTSTFPFQASHIIKFLYTCLMKYIS